MSFHIQAPGNDNLTSPIDRGNGQHNLVLLQVDKISARQPRLEGIWLLITLPQSSTLTLVPVFPDHTRQTQTLQEAFEMTDANHPGKEFQDLLTEIILWDDFLVIDREGISSALKSFEPAEMEALGAVPQLNMDVQISIWQTMCDHLSRLKSRAEFDSWIQQVSSNFSTNLSWDELPLNSWGQEGIEDNLGCEFPTLNLISP